jgi:uridine kinase
MLGMVSDRIQKILSHKSKLHQIELRRLGEVAEDAPLSSNAIILKQTNQIRGINTLLLNPETPREDYIFYFDRMVALLIERAIDFLPFQPKQVWTPHGNTYMGLDRSGEVCLLSPFPRLPPKTLFLY